MLRLRDDVLASSRLFLRTLQSILVGSKGRSSKHISEGRTAIRFLPRLVPSFQISRGSKIRRGPLANLVRGDTLDRREKTGPWPKGEVFGESCRLELNRSGTGCIFGFGRPNPKLAPL